MYHFHYSIKDSSIYEYALNKNTGSDEILELDRTAEGKESRIVAQFEIENLINTVEGASGLPYTCSVQYNTTQVSNLPIEYSIFVSALSKPFKRGVGRKFNNTTQGVNWIDTGTGLQWNMPGGDFYTATESEEKYRFERSDIDIEINDIFDDWIRGVKNNGIIIRMKPKYPNAASNKSQIDLKYFGSLTHTIYRPRIVLKFDDSASITSGGIPMSVQDNPQTQFTGGLESKYTPSGITTFSFSVNPRYQKQDFVEEPMEKSSVFLKNGSIRYSIRDKVTGKTVIPFSKESTCSFDPDNGYSFDLDLNGWMPNRYYEILLEFQNDITRQRQDLTPYTNTFKIHKK